MKTLQCRSSALEGFRVITVFFCRQWHTLEWRSTSIFFQQIHSWSDLRLKIKFAGWYAPLVVWLSVYCQMTYLLALAWRALWTLTDVLSLHSIEMYMMCNTNKSVGMIFMPRDRINFISTSFQTLNLRSICFTVQVFKTYFSWLVVWLWLSAQDWKCCLLELLCQLDVSEGAED